MTNRRDDARLGANMSEPGPDQTKANSPRTPRSGEDAERAAPSLEDSAAPKAAAPDPAEQMALYEKELRENDWGHQPC